MTLKPKRRFSCIACKMTIIFPKGHTLEKKLEGSYSVQEKWFCSQECFNAVYFPPSSERR